MRNDPLTRAPLFLFAIDPQLVTVQGYPDLISRDTRKFDANTNGVGCLTDIDRRRPPASERRRFSFGGFLQDRKELDRKSVV